ncbi:hypothetical protein HCH52_10980 [Oscillospiraceae bacterium HV4-5-C5C]|nr:hypothetical protein [Oscillospiraceae bacterium HV4-5-C5C]
MTETSLGLRKSAGLKKLTTFDLKIIGLVLMFIDHVYQMFVPMGLPVWLNWFGRPVATIFFFVSVEGFSHTHNKKKYLLRLYIGMLLMFAGTNILSRLLPYEQVQLANNIFVDLFVGAIMMAGIDLIEAGIKSRKAGRVAAGVLVCLIPVLLSGLVVLVLSQGYHSVGVLVAISVLPSLVLAENNFMVLLIPLLYIFRRHRNVQCVLIALTALIYLSQGSVQWMMIFAVIPILLYNGQKGPGLKYFFYVFYPAHIWLLYLLSFAVYHFMH